MASIGKPGRQGSKGVDAFTARRNRRHSRSQEKPTAAAPIIQIANRTAGTVSAIGVPWSVGAGGANSGNEPAAESRFEFYSVNRAPFGDVGE
jgi:hypothetical protein